MKTLKFAILLFSLISIEYSGISQTFHKPLQNYSDEVTNEFNLIDKDRKSKLDTIAAYFYKDWTKDKETNALLICTHNSRRSHMSSLWFQTASYFYGLTGFYSFSGGTEATAFNKRAVDALERAGFKYSVSDSSTKNIVYTFSIGDRYPEKKHFSKKFSHKSNPKKDFFAIMVCSDADKSCPFVPGANNRFALPFKDPRYSDNTASETAEYDKTSRLIAREMFYLANQIKQKIVVFQESKKK